MTVSSTTTRNSYAGDGSTTAFSYTFKIFDEDDIAVILRNDTTAVETTQSITTNYTVSGVGNAGGGTITFVTAPPTGNTVVLLRTTARTQLTDYTPNDPFPAESHEDALDKLTFIAQELEEEVGRAIKLSKTNEIATAEFSVGAAARANKILSFDANGDLTVTEGKVDTVTATASGLAAGSTPTATATYTGSTGALAIAFAIPEGATGPQGPAGADGAGTGDLISTNNLSDLDNAATALTNLGLTATAAEINYNDITTLGTVEASKAVTADSSGEIIMPDDKKIYFGSDSDAFVQYDETTDDRLKIGGANVEFEKAVIGATDTSSGLTLDFDANQNFFVTLSSGANTLAQPSTEANNIGQTGFIIFIQPSSGNPGLLSHHADYETAGAATLTLSSTNSAYDVVPYIIKADNSILLGTPQLAFA